MAAQGVWVSTKAETSDVRSIFTTELLASRDALQHGGKVLFWPFGGNEVDAVEATRALHEKPATRASKPKEPKS